MESEKYLRVLEAAKTVFLRYGFKRVTMQDIADEAGISRPALYLLLPNKEEAFKASIQNVSAASMAEIRAGLPTISDEEAKLRFVFEIWTVRPFQLMLSSPDAKDLVHCGQDFAGHIFAQVASEFESLLTEILKPLAALNRPAILPAAQIAHLLAASIHGYKDAARSVDELRQMIHGLIKLTLAALTPAALTSAALNPARVRQQR
jgi:AcrR family transcriptional regulator